jgi:TonB family protein
LALGVAGLIHLIVLFWSPGFQPTGDPGATREHEMQAVRLVPLGELQRAEIRRPAPPVRVGTRARVGLAGRSVPGRPAIARDPVPAPPKLPEVEPDAELAAIAEAANVLADAAPPIVVPALPPDAAAPTLADPEIARFRHVTALMEKPELMNRSEVRRALLREYPRALQRRGVEGVVMVWYWIDDVGKVEKYEIRGSSGSLELDAAAERVIPVMRFRPATEWGKKVPVIVTLPIRFEAR